MSTGRAGTWATAAAAEGGDPSRQFCVDAGGVYAPLNARLAGGHPRRRLLIRSRKRLGSLAAIHDRPPWLDNKHEDRSHDVAAAASHFSLSPRLAVTPAVLTVKAVLEVIHIDTMGPQRAHFPMWGARS
jgi:hypothetical protein